MELKITAGKTFTAKTSENIYRTLKNNGVYLVASCGGKGICGKCCIKIIEGKYHVESTGKLQKKDIDENIVLACQSFPEENVLIEIPEESKLVIGDKIAVSRSKDLLEFLYSVEPTLTPAVRRIELVLEPPSINDNISDLERLKKALADKGIENMRFSYGFVSSMSKALRDARWKVNIAYTENFEAISLSSTEDRNRYGIAVDIGTTTIVVFLINYSDGSLVDSGMTYNSQMRFGDDVITRIVHATEGDGINELRNSVVNDINDLISPIIEKNIIRKEAIDSAAQYPYTGKRDPLIIRQAASEDLWRAAA